MTEQELRDLIAAGETLTIEFKSDQGPLSDAALLGTVVCLANGQGGTLLIGVEDNGRVTGLHPRHRTHPAALAAFVANRTVPPATVEAEFVELPEETVAVLAVSAARQPVSTSDGRLLIRYVDSRGQPGCRPLYAYELTNRLAERGQADASAMVVPDATWDDLDPLEFARLLRMVQENRGDAALLELTAQEIARALGLTRDENGAPIPTLAGLLLVGRESALRDHVPAHEIAFQVLRGTDVAVNEFRRWPLLRAHEWLMQAIGVRNEEQELMMGSFRVGVPRYDWRGIREAINNALIHRDYTQLGAIHVQFHDDYALVTSPGGFVTGVHVGNLLTAAPRPRNPLLADDFKRVGLVERTGRGVGIIYTGQLQNGRRPPDYGRSTNVNVTVTLDSGPADLDFVRLSIQANRHMGRALRVEELLALRAVWQAGKTSAEDLAPLLQQDVNGAAVLLAELARVGLFRLVEGAYTLAVERPQTGEKARPALSPAAAILAHVRAQGRITRRQAIAATGLSEEQARYQLRKLTESGALELVGTGRGAYYRAPQTVINGE